MSFSATGFTRRGKDDGLRNWHLAGKRQDRREFQRMNSTRECFAGVESEQKKLRKKQSDTKRLIIESSQKRINAMPPIEVPANKNYADFDTHTCPHPLY